MIEADLLLVKRAQKGDADAFETLYCQHLKQVYNFAWCIMGNSADAEDVTQKVMLKAWRILPAFKLDNDFYIWLYRIAVNVCCSELRRHKTKMVSVGEMQSGGSGEYGMMGGSVVWAIAKLDEEYRAVLVLRDVEGYAYNEIAEIMHCPIGTVRTKINQAREQMRDILFANGTIA